MQMISIVFLLFTALILGILWILNRILKDDSKKILFSRWVLLAGSFLFAAYGDLRFALVLGALCLVTWLTAGRKNGWKWGVAFALLTLGFFKYTNFFLSSLGRLFGFSHTALHLLLPLGISFYTFSAISYLVDVHRGNTAKKSFSEVALYLSFFPKLTSGPIARSGDFFQQLDRPRNIGFACISAGVQIFAFGLFKKIVLADRLSVFVGQVFHTPRAFDSLTVLLGVFAYGFQLYFDFSGYSDMAIGIAKMLDVDLPKNFDLPYLSRNITEFWKRWHITLSSWLQDYLYIPLGGSRKGKVRTYVNLILTMVLGGLWHGASLTYVVWGLLNGVGLMIHKLFCLGDRKRMDNPFVNVLSIAGTFLFVSFTWIFFRAETFQDALTILSVIFSFQAGVRQLYVWFFWALLFYAVCVAAAAYHSRHLKGKQKKKNTCWIRGYYPILDLNSFWGLTLFFVFCGLILGLAYTGGSPFIYGGY